MTKSANAIRISSGDGYRGLRAVLILVMIVFSMTAFSQNITVRGTVTDASSTALCGVRGSNGIIIITTRSGEEGMPRDNLVGRSSDEVYLNIMTSR